MQKDNNLNANTSYNGVMLNAYPDSIGEKLSDTIRMLKMPQFHDVFSLFYVLPTFFNSDLDRGFSVIDYNLNKELVSEKDLKDLEELNIMLKFDIVLNHLSVASPQFKDLLKHGNQSKYKDFFINWNTFWEGYGELNEKGIIIPKRDYLDKLFMRKSGLPILKVLFPDGSEQPYWNTFYQQITFNEISTNDLVKVEGLTLKKAESICEKVNSAIQKGEDFNTIDFGDDNNFKESILKIINQNRSYLGQMDVNAKSELVWDFYVETLAKVKGFGCKILRLDAFAYLHKEIGQTNFFNKPGTWNYLERIKQIAEKNDLMLLPEIHAEYGLALHDEVAKKGYQIYDFFLPGLMIHTLENGTSKALLTWIKDIIKKGYKTVNMLGCHDGIPVLDLKGKEVNGTYHKGLLEDKDIEAIMNTIMERGGRVKNLYDAEGKKISYYQVNATLSIDDIKKGLEKEIVKNQLKIMRLRNTSKAFLGSIKINNTSDNEIDIYWSLENDYAHLKADLNTFEFTINYSEDGIDKLMSF